MNRFGLEWNGVVRDYILLHSAAYRGNLPEKWKVKLDNQRMTWQLRNRDILELVEVYTELTDRLPDLSWNRDRVETELMTLLSTGGGK